MLLGRAVEDLAHRVQVAEAVFAIRREVVAFTPLVPVVEEQEAAAEFVGRQRGGERGSTETELGEQNEEELLLGFSDQLSHLVTPLPVGAAVQSIVKGRMGDSLHRQEHLGFLPLMGLSTHPASLARP